MRSNLQGIFEGMNATPCYAFQNAARVAILTGIILIAYTTQPIPIHPNMNEWVGDLPNLNESSATRHLPGMGFESNGEPALARQLSEEMPVWEKIVRSVAVAVLVFFSGSFAGLLLGLMGPEKNQLQVCDQSYTKLPRNCFKFLSHEYSIMSQILKEAGSAEERDYAQRIWDIRRYSNLLMCTLLIGNVAVNSLISIISAGLTTGNDH